MSPRRGAEGVWGERVSPHRGFQGDEIPLEWGFQGVIPLG